MTAAVIQVRRELRGDGWVLAVLGLLVAAATALCALGPAVLAGHEDRALRQRIDRAQARLPLVTVTGSSGPGDGAAPQRLGLADLVASGWTDLRTDTGDLQAELRPRDASVTFDMAGTDLRAPGQPDVHRIALVPGWISTAAAHLRWTAGHAPRSAGGRVEFALSEAAARLYGIGPEAVVDLQLPGNGLFPVGVQAVLAGVFRPRTDGGDLAQDPFWGRRPMLVAPLTVPDSATGHGRVSAAGALLDAEAVEQLHLRNVQDPGFTWSFIVRPARAAVAQAERDAYPLSRLGAMVRDGQCSVPDASSGADCLIGTHRLQTLETQESLSTQVNAFLTERRQTRSLLAFAVASLVGVLLSTAVVAVRLLLRRRAAELRLQSSRGASARRLVGLRTAPAVPVVLLAAAAGWTAGELTAPQGASAGGSLTATLLVLAAGLAVVPLLTWWAVREPRGRRTAPGRGSAPPRRLVLELLLLLLTVAGVVSVRLRGAAAPDGPDLQLAATPLLIGAVTVLVLLRLYPLVLRWAARRVRGGRGLLGFVGLARAGQDAPATALALFVLVLTLGTAVFGGLVQRSVTDGVAAGAEWRAGADASATAPGTVQPAAVTGVRTVLLRLRTSSVTGDLTGSQDAGVDIVTVDSAALRAARPDSPLARALARLGPAGAEDLPALADPDLLRQEPGGGFTTALSTRRGVVPPLHLRVRATLDRAVRDDPALGPLRAELGDGPLVIVDTAAERLMAPQTLGSTAVLLYGGDQARLRTAAGTVLGPLATTTLRADALAALRADGLAREVTAVYGWCSVPAVLAGLLAVALELLLTARERGRTASYLRTLGLGGRAAAGLQLLQLAPFALVSAVGGAALGLLEPWLLGPALSLRQFTGGPDDPPLHGDWRLVAALAAGMALLVLAAAAAEAVIARTRRLGAVLRLGEV